MKLIILYCAVALSCLQQAVGSPVLEADNTGHVAGFDKGNQKNIVGREKYPYMVFLEFYDRIKQLTTFCGGTIIRGRVVLTAAHCFSATSGDINVVAVAGILDLKEERRKAQVVKMYDYLIHEKFVRFAFKKNAQGEQEVTDFRDDIALVWFETHFTYNAKVNQIPLMSPNVKLGGKTGFILGWGNTEKGKCSYMLKSAHLKVVKKSECEYKQNGKHYVIDKDRSLCTKSDNLKSQQCSGDSGGPFIINNKLAGIISHSYKEDFTLPNGKQVEMTVAKYGATVTNVAFYNQWVLNNLELGPPRDRRNKNKKKPGQHGSRKRT